jgi:hypothetical protein
MVVSRGVRARVGLPLALLTALALPTAVSAVRNQAPTLTVDDAAVNATWKEGWLRPGAAVRFSGSVSEASDLTATLRPIGRSGVTARAEFHVPQAGTFSKAMPLPPRALPGAYRLRVASVGPAPKPSPVDVNVTIPAPPEGVIDRALVGTTRNGPWLRYVGKTGPAVSGAQKELWVRFRFLYPPSGQRVQLVWKLSWHRVVGKVYRRYKNTIDTYARSETALPKGVWYVVLTINGRIAKRMDVRLR